MRRLPRCKKNQGRNSLWLYEGSNSDNGRRQKDNVGKLPYWLGQIKGGDMEILTDQKGIKQKLRIHFSNKTIDFISIKEVINNVARSILEQGVTTLNVENKTIQIINNKVDLLEIETIEEQ